jgi:hypothetical protein
MAALLKELSERLNWNFGYVCGFWRGGICGADREPVRTVAMSIET